MTTTAPLDPKTVYWADVDAGGVGDGPAARSQHGEYRRPCNHGAFVWSFLLLGERLNGRQFVGIAIVLSGLLAFLVTDQRGDRTARLGARLDTSIGWSLRRRPTADRRGPAVCSV